MLLNHLLSVTFLQMLQGDVTKSHKCSSVDSTRGCVFDLYYVLN
jgi:hypothetical protein